MSDAPNITDRESLAAWLNTRPHEDAVIIAHRAAMRVLPLWLRAVPHLSDLTALPILRCDLISGVARKYPAPEIKIAASAAARAASVWRDVQIDTARLVEGADLLTAPLWDGENPLAGVWADHQSVLASPPGGSFWTDWYERALKGAPQPWPLLRDVALIGDDLWTAAGKAKPGSKDWVALDDAIRGLVADHDIRQFIGNNPHGYRVEASRSGRKLVAKEAPHVALERIIKNLRQALRDFIRRNEKESQGNNLRVEILCHARPAIEEFRKKIPKCRNNPQGLFDQIEASQKELIDRLSGVGLQHEVLVHRLLEGLDVSKNDICLLDPAVLEHVKRRHAVKVALFTQQHIELLIRMTRGMADDSEGLLKIAATRAIAIISDDQASDQDKASAFYFVQAVLPRGAVVMADIDEARSEEKAGAYRHIIQRADEIGKLYRAGEAADAVYDALPPPADWAASFYQLFGDGGWLGMFPQPPSG